MTTGVDALLRAVGPFAPHSPALPVRRLVAILCLGAFLYGVALGTFGERALQALYSGLKVPLLLVASTLVCLPSFCVVNAALGLAGDLRRALIGVLCAQATVAVSLAAMAPLTLVVYASSDSYHLATVANGLLFAVAAICGQTTLARHYAPMIADNRRHLWLQRIWVVLYVFVAIQAAWMLRPFIGDPALPTRFLRDEPLRNAYVVVSQTVWRLLVR